MSPTARMREFAQHMHMPRIHVGHLHPLTWAEKVLTNRSFWVVVAAIALLTGLMLLLIWVLPEGGLSGDKTFNPFLYGP